MFLTERLLFIHIPKNAGTSMVYLLEKNFSGRKNFDIDTHSTFDLFKKKYLNLCKNKTSFCLIRNPFCRFVSIYANNSAATLTPPLGFQKNLEMNSFRSGFWCCLFCWRCRRWSIGIPKGYTRTKGIYFQGHYHGPLKKHIARQQSSLLSCQPLHTGPVESRHTVSIALAANKTHISTLGFRWCPFYCMRATTSETLLTTSFDGFSTLNGDF